MAERPAMAARSAAEATAPLDCSRRCFRRAGPPTNRRRPSTCASAPWPAIASKPSECEQRFVQRQCERYLGRSDAPNNVRLRPLIAEYSRAARLQLAAHPRLRIHRALGFPFCRTRLHSDFELLPNRAYYAQAAQNVPLKLSRSRPQAGLRVPMHEDMQLQEP